MRHVILSEQEQKIAVYIGKKRNELSMRTKWNLRRDPLQDDEMMHIQAMGAELAVAKWLNVYPDMSPTDSALPQFDLIHDGRKVEVKRRDRTNLDLLLPNFRHDATYVLVYGRIPEFTIAGSIDGDRIPEVGEWREDLPYGSCWLIKRDFLRQAN